MEEKNDFQLIDRIYFPATLILIAVTSFVLNIKLATYGYDMIMHISWANQYWGGETNDAVYPGFYWLYGVFNRLFNVPDIYAGAYANTCFTILCSLMIYVVISCFFRDKEYITEKTKSLIVLFMMFFGPIYLAGFNGSNYYKGQGSFNTWHNPTNNAVRFLCIAVFYLFVYSFFYMKDEQEIKVKNIYISKLQINILIGILTFVSLLFKPSFFQVFAPTVAICFLLDFITDVTNVKLDIKKYLFNIIIFIPAGLLIVYQALFVFAPEKISNGVEIAPFDVWHHMSSNIPVSIIATVAFPLFIILFFYPVMQRSKLLQVSSIFYFVSFAEFALLAETGGRRYSGNFGWGMNLGIGVLFLSSILEFIIFMQGQDNYKFKNIKGFLGFMLLAAHFFWGIWYYWQLNINPSVQCF